EMDDLIKLARQRVQQAEASKADRIVGQDEVSGLKAASRPSDVERAVQLLEKLNAERLGDASNEILKRLLPFLQAAFKRVKIELPVDKITSILNSKPK